MGGSNGAIINIIITNNSYIGHNYIGDSSWAAAMVKECEEENQRIDRCPRHVFWIGIWTCACDVFGDVFGPVIGLVFGHLFGPSIRTFV